MNNFAGDGNCKALWRFENGALTVDSKGGNTLTAVNTPTADLVNFKEGAASVLLQMVDLDYLVRNDVGLDAGFPLKNGDVIKKISVAFWAYFDGMPIDTTDHFVYSKFSAAQNSIRLGAYTNGVPTNFRLGISNNGIAWTNYDHASVMVSGRWYHIGVTYQDSDGAYRIRIWDDTAGAILGVDKTGNAVNVFVGAGPVRISLDTLFTTMDGKIDEMVVFNDILTVAEIDMIRAGTYPTGGAPPVFGNLNRKRCPLAAAQKVGMLAEL